MPILKTGQSLTKSCVSDEAEAPTSTSLLTSLAFVAASKASPLPAQPLFFNLPLNGYLHVRCSVSLDHQC